MAPRLSEGWYLMSVPELERELARQRGEEVSPSSAVPLTVEQALRYRDRGNLPDADGRTLRLVLHVEDRSDLDELEAKRRFFEPDVHDPPTWRRPGSAPVNVVPLRTGRLPPTESEAWWDDPELAALEDEWMRTGSVSGLRVPGPYRGFIYKTVLGLQAAGRPVTAESVAGSVARWLRPADAAELRRALEEMN